MSQEPLQLFQLAHYSDGAIAAIQSPPVSAGAMEVRYLHEQLRHGFVKEKQLWPLNQIPLEEICDRYAPYFQAISQYLRPRLDLKRLSCEQQFYWFVATEPEQLGERSLLGLSHVETLIGVQRKIVAEEEPTDSSGKSLEEEDFVEGTGDPLLDLISDMHLVFKTSARHLLSSYSPGACQRMLVYAGRRKAQAMSKMKSDMGKDEGAAATRPMQDAPSQPAAPELTPAMKEALKRRGIDSPG